MNSTLLAVLSTLGIGSMISGIILKKLNMMDNKHDAVERDRVEENIIIITSLGAIGSLAEATAIAQQQGKCNGEMTAAMSCYAESKKCLTDFLVRQSARQTHCNK